MAKQINADALILKFRESFQRKLSNFAESIAKEMVSLIGVGSDADIFASEVKSYVKTKILQQDSKWQALVGLVGDDIPEDIYYKAFIMAYGSGINVNSKDNPWFDEFFTGNYNGMRYWNPHRFKSGAITYRELDEPYYDFYHDTINRGHGPNKNGEYHALPLKSFVGNPWFNNALEKAGIPNRAYIDGKITEFAKEAFNEACNAFLVFK